MHFSPSRHLCMLSKDEMEMPWLKDGQWEEERRPRSSVNWTINPGIIRKWLPAHLHSSARTEGGLEQARALHAGSLPRDAARMENGTQLSAGVPELKRLDTKCKMHLGKSSDSPGRFIKTGTEHQQSRRHLRETAEESGEIQLLRK